jgi:hypothetical protein
MSTERKTHKHSRSCKHKRTHKHSRSCKHKRTHKHSRSCKHKRTHKHSRTCKHKRSQYKRTHKHSRTCKHKRKRSQYKRSQRKRTFRGGTATPVSTRVLPAVAPFETYGYQHNAGSAREAALLTATVNNQQQHAMNQTGGADPAPAVATVPQWPPIGGIPAKTDASTLSIDTNTSSLQGATNALNDCYATDSCPPATGGRRAKKRM